MGCVIGELSQTGAVGVDDEDFGIVLAVNQGLKGDASSRGWWCRRRCCWRRRWRRRRITCTRRSRWRSRQWHRHRYRGGDHGNAAEDAPPHPADGDRLAGAQVNGIQLAKGPTLPCCRRQRSIGHIRGRDVKTHITGGVYTQGANRCQRAGVRRILHYERVRFGVNVIQRGLGRSGHAVGVTGAGDSRVPAGIDIARSIGQRRVVDSCSRIGIDAQVLLGVADHTQAIRHRVEIHTEVAAVEGRCQGTAHCGCRCGAALDKVGEDIQAVEVAHAVELAVGAEVNAHQLLAIGQAIDAARATALQIVAHAASAPDTHARVKEHQLVIAGKADDAGIDALLNLRLRDAARCRYQSQQCQRGAHARGKWRHPLRVSGETSWCKPWRALSSASSISMQHNFYLPFMNRICPTRDSPSSGIEHIVNDKNGRVMRRT